MFRQRAGLKGYDEWIKAFCQRKYESDFSREMSRSAQRWMGPFQP
jgi:hypothetical protein